MYAKLLTTLSLMMVLTIAHTQAKKRLDRGVLDSLFKSLRQHTPSAHVMSGHGAKRGVVRSCGPPKTNFTMEWEPLVLNPEGNVTVHYNFKPLYDIKTAILSWSLSYGSSALIFEDTQRVDCSDIGKFFPCPIKAGTHFKGDYNYPDLLELQGFEDTYSIKINLTTDDEKVIVCAKATVTVRN